MPNFVVGNWVRLYNTASTIRQRAKAGTGAKMLKTKSALMERGRTRSLPSAPAPLATTPVTVVTCLSNFRMG